MPQLPRKTRRRVLIHADPSGDTHKSRTGSPARRLAYSIGFIMTDESCDAIGRPLPDSDATVPSPRFPMSRNAVQRKLMDATIPVGVRVVMSPTRRCPGALDREVPAD